jgi:hypothetical protein
MSPYPGRMRRLIERMNTEMACVLTQSYINITHWFSLYESDVKKTQFDLLSGLRRPENRFIIESSG